MRSKHQIVHFCKEGFQILHLICMMVISFVLNKHHKVTMWYIPQRMLHCGLLFRKRCTQSYMEQGLMMFFFIYINNNRNIYSYVIRKGLIVCSSVKLNCGQISGRPYYICKILNTFVYILLNKILLLLNKDFLCIQIYVTHFVKYMIYYVFNPFYRGK